MSDRDASVPAEARTRNDWVVDRLVPERDMDDLVDLLESAFVKPWTREMLERELLQPDVSRILVMRMGSRLIAFCACWLVGDELHINNLAVSHDARRRGAATRLLEVTLREAVRLGITRATLEVRRSNEAARRLYERLGFSVTGVRRQYYRTPVEDALILWRDNLGQPGESANG